MHQSPHSFTPKIHATLSLIRDVLLRREQVVVFAALHSPNDMLGWYLSEAGVRFEIMDGRHTPSKRGDSSKAFKQKRFPVLLCGVESCAEGHSWPQANNVICLSYSWAYDRDVQSVNRVHRINSEQPVNVYHIVCDGSIDRKLEAMLSEKSDAAELVLDGQLLGEDSCEVNLAELLQIAHTDFAGLKPSGTLDERDLEREWPALRSQLAQAMKLWSQPANVIPLPVQRPSAVALATPVSLPAHNSDSSKNAAAWWDNLPLWQQAV